MFKRKLDSDPVTAHLKDYNLVVDYCACMVAASIVRHLVVANNVHIQWSADQLKESLNDTALRRDPNFYIDGIALSHGFLMFRKDLAKRGITVIEIFQDDKCVPSYYDMKASRMSIEVKFTAYHTPHSVEADSVKELLFGTMLVVPDGTIDEELDEHDLLPDLPVVDEEENVERALFLYFVNNNNVLNTEPHDDDDTDDLVDSESD
jgi:hypothetical protein